MKELLQAKNLRSGQVLAAAVEKAEGLRDRMVGLLGRKDLPAGQALWLLPCSQVHTFFMAFPIDVLFLDKGGKVLAWRENLVPWRLSPWVFRAHSVLELPSGALAGKVEKGDVVGFTSNG